MPKPNNPARNWANFQANPPLTCINKNVPVVDRDLRRIMAPAGNRFDLANHEPVEFLDACRSPSSLADAVGMLEAVAATKSTTRSTKGIPAAVYVIQAGDDPISKIGVSANPLRRVLDLQSAHYRELFLWAVLFCPTHKAVFIERRVLDRADADGSRLMGEWIAKEPEEVLLDALEMARDHDVPVCDGRTWFMNMIGRTRTLHQRHQASLNVHTRHRAA